MRPVGSREAVLRGYALQTPSGLTKRDFIQKPDGTWVSRRMSEAAKRRWNSDPVLRTIFAQEQAPAFGSGVVRRSARRAVRSVRRRFRPRTPPRRA